MATQAKMNQYLRYKKYTHYYYFRNNRFFRRLLSLLYTKESGIRYGFHSVQFERMIDKMDEDDFKDVEKAIYTLYGQSFGEVVLSILATAKDYAMQIEDVSTPFRSNDKKLFWKQTIIINVLKELLYAHSNHMQLFDLLEDRHGFYGGVYWLATTLKDESFEVIEAMIQKSNHPRQMEKLILVACMGVDKPETHAYLLEHIDVVTQIYKPQLSFLNQQVFKNYFLEEAWFDQTSYIFYLRAWTGLQECSDTACWQLFQHFQNAFYSEETWLEEYQMKNWMATYAALFVKGSSDMDEMSSCILNLMKEGSKAQQRGVMRLLYRYAFLKRDISVQAKDVNNLDMIAFLAQPWIKAIQSKDYTFQDISKKKLVFIETLFSWLKLLPKGSVHVFDAGKHMGGVYHVDQTMILSILVRLVDHFEKPLHDCCDELASYRDVFDQESANIFVNHLLCDCSRDVIKPTLISYATCDNELIAKNTLHQLRQVLFCVNLYHKHKWVQKIKWLNYLNYMDPFTEEDLDAYRKFVPEDHILFDVLAGKVKVKPIQEHEEKVAKKANNTMVFGKWLALQDDFHNKKLTVFYKNGIVKSGSLFQSFSSDMLTHFVQAYQEMGVKACEQLNFKQTVYIYFRMFVMPDMSIYGKLMYAKMYLLFHVKQFQDHAQASLSNQCLNEMKQDLMNHMYAFDEAIARDFFYKMLEHIDTVMDSTYLTTSYRVKPYLVPNEHGIDADFIQFWIRMARVTENEDTKLATLKHIYQLAKKGGFYNLCELTIQDINMLYDHSFLHDMDVKMLFVKDYASLKVNEGNGMWVDLLKNDLDCGVVYSSAFQALFMKIEDQYVAYLLEHDAWHSGVYPITKVSHMDKILAYLKQAVKNGSDVSQAVSLCNEAVVYSKISDWLISLEDYLFLDRIDFSITPYSFGIERPRFMLALYPYQEAVPDDFLESSFEAFMALLESDISEDEVSMLDRFHDVYPSLNSCRFSLMRQAIHHELDEASLKAHIQATMDKEALFCYCLLPLRSEAKTQEQVDFIHHTLHDEKQAQHFYIVLAAINGYQDYYLFQNRFLPFLKAQN